MILGSAAASNDFSMTLKTVFSLSFSSERMNLLVSISDLGGSSRRGACDLLDI
jgi:hypothetical protein